MANNSSYCKQYNLFKDTYWNYTTTDNFIKDVIVKNRNKFAVDYELRAYKGSEYPQQANQFFDHCERYTSRLGTVYIVSPYQNFDEFAEKISFSKYLTLYGLNTNTYIRVFKNTQSLKRFFKQYDEKINKGEL